MAINVRYVNVVHKGTYRNIDIVGYAISATVMVTNILLYARVSYGKTLAQK